MRVPIKFKRKYTVAALLIAGLGVALAWNVTSFALDTAPGPGDLSESNQTATEEAVGSPGHCYGLPLDQAAECYQQYIDAHSRQQEELIRAFIDAGRDFRQLPVTDLPGGSYFARSLEFIIDESDLIILGTVVKQTLSAEGRITSAIAVDQAIKGSSAAGTITLSQTGGVSVSPDGSAHLLQDAMDPILWPGRQYLLFLTDSDADGVYRILAPDGYFEVTPQGLRSPGLMDWVRALESRPPEVLINLLQTSLR
jgi:hypothetical protein